MAAAIDTVRRRRIWLLGLLATYLLWASPGLAGSACALTTDTQAPAVPGRPAADHAPRDHGHHHVDHDAPGHTHAGAHPSPAADAGAPDQCCVALFAGGPGVFADTSSGASLRPPSADAAPLVPAPVGGLAADSRSSAYGPRASGPSRPPGRLPPAYLRLGSLLI